MSAFHPRTPTLFLCALSLSLSRSALHLPMSCPPSRVLVSQLARKHTHMPINKQKKKHLLKVCEMKPQHHNIILSNKKEVFDLAAGLGAAA